MIGRSDYELMAPPRTDLQELITCICRHRWRQGLFLDADETDLIPLISPKLAMHAPSPEFFIFSDRKTADEWEELGPCPENWNRMLHFLWDPDASDESASVTVVIDELTPDIQSLFDDLQETFRDAEYFIRPEAA